MAVETLEQMIVCGMNVGRLNFSHGSHEYHANTIKHLRQAAANYSKKIGVYSPLAIALDTKGPEIRTGLLKGVSRLSSSNKCILKNYLIYEPFYFRVIQLKLN